MTQNADARFTPMEGSQASGSATETDLRTAIASLTEARDGDKQAFALLAEQAAALLKSNEALTAAHERLRTLSVKWRDIASRPNRPTGFLICADELDAALVSLKEPSSNTERSEP